MFKTHPAPSFDFFNHKEFQVRDPFESKALHFILTINAGKQKWQDFGDIRLIPVKSFDPTLYPARRLRK
jgi:hypothetical protein